MLEFLIASSVLIGVFLLMRPLFRGRISHRLQYALWLVVLLRLVLPVQLASSRISVLNLLELLPSGQAQTWQTGAAGPETAQIDTASAPTQDAAPVRPQRTVHWFAIVWAAGAVVVGAAFLIANIRFGRRLRRTSRRLPYDEALPVFCAPGLASPCLFGLFQPAVYLTELAAGSFAHRDNAVRHELTHYRHYDHIWAIVRCAVLAVYWFDPLVWLAARASKEDCELACDESCIRGMTKRGKLDYGKTLVAIVAQGRGFSTLGSAATSMTNTNTTMKTRVQAVAKQRRYPVWMSALAIVLTLLAAGCTFTSAAGENGDVTMRLYDMRSEDAQNLLAVVRRGDAANELVQTMLRELQTSEQVDDDRAFKLTYGLQIVESAGETDLILLGFDEAGRACAWSEEYGIARTVTQTAYADAFREAFGLEAG